MNATIIVAAIGALATVLVAFLTRRLTMANARKSDAEAMAVFIDRLQKSVDGLFEQLNQIRALNEELHKKYREAVINETKCAALLEEQRAAFNAQRGTAHTIKNELHAISLKVSLLQIEMEKLAAANGTGRNSKDPVLETLK